MKGLRITAAEGPDLALKRLLRGAGIEPGRDVEIVELPGAKLRDVSFGVFAARAPRGPTSRWLLGQRHGR